MWIQNFAHTLLPCLFTKPSILQRAVCPRCKLDAFCGYFYFSPNSVAHIAFVYISKSMNRAGCVHFFCSVGLFAFCSSYQRLAWNKKLATDGYLISAPAVLTKNGKFMCYNPLLQWPCTQWDLMSTDRLP